MAKLVILFVELWRKRYHIIVPAILIPLAAVAWSMSQQQIYQARTTLKLNKEQSLSPLLQNISHSDNAAILSRLLKGKNVIEDTMKRHGLIMSRADTPEAQQQMKEFASRVSLAVPSDDLMVITYLGQQTSDLTDILETLSYNFIRDILAPERFQTETMLLSLREQAIYYGEQLQRSEKSLSKVEKLREQSADAVPLKEVIALEFEVTRANAQKMLAESEYDTLLKKSKSLFSSMQGNSPNTILWFLELPVQITLDEGNERHIQIAKQALILSLILSLFGILLAYFNDRTLRKEDDIYEALGLKILGHIPNLGKIETQNGRLIVDLQAPKI